MPSKGILLDMVEKFRKYDISGRETDESQAQAEAAATQAAIDRAEKLESLQKHPGWKLLEEEMSLLIAKYTDELVYLQEEKTIRQYQEGIKARKQLLNWISNSIKEGKSYLEELNTKAPVKGDNLGG